MNNFAALFAFNAAFQSSQVYRLKHTWKVRGRGEGKREREREREYICRLEKEREYRQSGTSEGKRV